MNKERPITLALIGRGQWGQNYITTINALTNCQLPEEYIKTRDYMELFQHTDIQGIIIATPTSTHFDIAKECLMRNYNVLIEKPITKTLQEALGLQQITLDHSQVVVLVGHVLLYDQAYSELKHRFGMVGEIQSLRFVGLKSPIREDMIPLEDWLPHPIYLFIDLLGKEPQGIAAKQTGVDTFHVDLRFDGNILGSVDIGWTRPERKRELTLGGTRGVLTLNTSTDPKTLSFADGISHKQWNFSPHQSALALEVLEFVQCIAKDKKPKTGLAQGIEVMNIIEHAKQSLALGGKYVRITLPAFESFVQPGKYQ